MPDNEWFWEVCPLHKDALTSCDCECTCGSQFPGLHTAACRYFDPERERKAGNRFYVKKRPAHA